MPILNLFLTDITLIYEHRPTTDYLCPRHSYFQRTDTSLVLYKLVVVAAQLFGASYIFVPMVLKFFQNRVQFSNDGIKFVTQLLVHLFLHKLVNGFENNIGLIGQKLLRSLDLLGEKMFHFSHDLSLELLQVAPGGGSMCSCWIIFHRHRLTSSV